MKTTKYNLLVTGDTNCQLSTTGFTPGVYVLQLINGENIRIQKIVVR